MWHHTLCVWCVCMCLCPVCVVCVYVFVYFCVYLWVCAPASQQTLHEPDKSWQFANMYDGVLVCVWVRGVFVCVWVCAPASQQILNMPDRSWGWRIQSPAPLPESTNSCVRAFLPVIFVRPPPLNYLFCFCSRLLALVRESEKEWREGRSVCIEKRGKERVCVCVGASISRRPSPQNQNV